MKTIVIDARFWGPSHTGLGRYTQSLITALHDLKPNFKISLLVPRVKKRELQSIFPRFAIIPVNSSHYTFSEQIEIPQVLNQLQPDLVHFLHFNAPIFYHRQFIVTIHDLIKHHSSGLTTTTRWPLIYPVKRLGYKLVIQNAINNSRLILTPSRWVKEDIKLHYSVSREKILITPEAADPLFFKPVPLVKNELIPSQPYLIYVGNAYPHKNIPQLIKAVLEYNQRYQQDLKLVIVTNKDIFYQRLRQQIRNLKALNVIKIKGFTDDCVLRSLYHYSAGFITASLFEGFGLPGLEAMAAKTLVLSSNQSCLPEVYGPHAFYFDPGNIEAIVAVISKALNLNNREKLLNQAQNYARNFSWEKTALATLNAYQKIL
ncbi:MAG: glycosyltransferase family 1 protein [Candidatus Beckwithbacteria bacterium]|nr:glycosyltransferase family 1 protein [Candidatus Beckwithbacteria bacterium]